MADSVKERVRIVYGGLCARLSVMRSETELQPQEDEANDYNFIIDEVKEITSHSYDRFKIKAACGPEYDTEYGMEEAYEFYRRETYLLRLSELIGRLHAEFFADEPSPLSGVPSSVISVNQQQSQTQYVQMILDVQSKLEQAIAKPSQEERVKSFAEKVKDKLAGVGNIIGLLNLLISTAGEVGITIEQLKEIFA